MYKGKKILAIIPARSGSKGYTDKNIKDLNGKPMIAYTIETARDSKVFDYIMVSTDSEKYAEISERFGAHVPFLRSHENSNDNASSWSVCLEVLQKLSENFDIVLLLQPTSPLRTAKNIQEAVDLFIEKNADVVVSITKTSHPIEWCGTLSESCSLFNFVKKEHANKRRQELPQSYILNGAIYAVKSDLINDKLDLFCEKSYAYIMDEDKSIDIDSKIDFIVAEAILKESALMK